jgi:hypothetical protein
VIRAVVVLIGLACLVAACGLVAPTPARHRPPLPPAEPMPELRVEDVVDGLAALGYACWFDPGGDIPSSWHCRLGDQDRNDFVDVGIGSGETGPIEHVSAYRHLGAAQEPVDAAALDEIGASAFAEVLLLIVPEAHRPTDGELLTGVQSNYPMELGGGWYLGFDRNSISRAMRLVYASDPR